MQLSRPEPYAQKIGRGDYSRDMKTHTRYPRMLLAASIALSLVTGCDSSPSAPGAAETTITITANGVTPKEVRIKAWNYVRFVNSDTRSHTIVSDPIDAHTQCPALNRVGILPPGQSKDSGTLTLAGTCGFHDHDDHAEAFRGRILIE